MCAIYGYVDSLQITYIMSVDIDQIKSAIIYKIINNYIYIYNIRAIPIRVCAFIDTIMSIIYLLEYVQLRIVAID